jgi:sec-independent protein translocase protein TatA
MFGLGSIWHWLIVLVVALLIFGTGRLRHVGRDIGTAIADFRKETRGATGQAPTTPQPAVRKIDPEV